MESVQSLGFSKIYVVVGHKSEEVKKEISSKFKCIFALQKEPLGTGDAVKSALDKIEENLDDLLVLNGDDSAFYSLQTLEQFIADHKKNNCPVSLMTLKIIRERRLGRVLRNNQGNFEKITEAERSDNPEISSDEINCGLYLFNQKWLKENIDKIKLSDRGEYYLTDIFNLAKEQGDCVNIFSLEDEREWVGVNTPDELVLANQQMQKKLKNIQ